MSDKTCKVCENEYRYVHACLDGIVNLIDNALRDLDDIDLQESVKNPVGDEAIILSTKLTVIKKILNGIQEGE